MLMSRNRSLEVGFVFAVVVLFGASAQAALPVSGASYHFDATEIDPGDLTEVRIDGSDTYVHTWEDQSGNANHAANGTESLQPLYIADGSKYGDRPVVLFNSDRLIASHAFADLDVAVGCTLFVVARQTTANGGTSHALDGGNPGVDDRRFCTQGDPSGADVRFNYRADKRSAEFRHNVSGTVGSNWNERTVWFDGNGGAGDLDKLDVYHNNSNTPDSVTQNGSGLGTTVGSVANVVIGALQSDGVASWSGEIAEIVMFPTALNGTDLAAMHSYLETKWFQAIQTLPVSGASYHFDAGTVNPTDVGQVRIDGADAYVHTWLDRSTNGNDAVQSTDALQPLYVAGGSEFGNLSVLDFDGDDAHKDRMIASHTFADLDAAVGCTLFVVAKQHVADGGTSHAVDNGFNVNDRRFCTQGDPSGADVRFNYRANKTTAEFRHNVSGVVASNWTERTVWFDGNGGAGDLDKLKVYHNYSNTPDSVTQNGSGLDTTVGAVANVVIGALESDGLAEWDGDIGEIIMFPTALNGTDLAKMHAWLKNRWRPAKGTLILLQ